MKQAALFICLVIYLQANAQISPADNKKLQLLEDSLKVCGKQMIRATDASARFYADSIFIKTFVRALRTNNSFYYPFDSVYNISKLYAPDSSFRIYTWEIEKDESYFRQYGAIQMRTGDGSLKLFPLYDASDFAAVPTDSVKTARNWIGAIYYQVTEQTFNDKKYYTLIGFDDNDFFSTKKWIEVLTFAPDGQPVFGGQYFLYKSDDLKPPQPAYRFCLEFKKDGGAKIFYDNDLKMIIFDHLISETNETSKKYTLIPDGDYEGFRWIDGRWVHVDKVFQNQGLKDGEAPVPMPYKEGKLDHQ